MKFTSSVRRPCHCFAETTFVGHMRPVEVSRGQTEKALTVSVSMVERGAAADRLTHLITGGRPSDLSPAHPVVKKGILTKDQAISTEIES